MSIQELFDWSSGYGSPLTSSGSCTSKLFIQKSRQQDINSVNKGNEPENEMETLSNNTTEMIMNLWTDDHAYYSASEPVYTPESESQAVTSFLHCVRLLNFVLTSCGGFTATGALGLIRKSSVKLRIRTGDPGEPGRLTPLSMSCHVSHNNMQILCDAMRIYTSTPLFVFKRRCGLERMYPGDRHNMITIYTSTYIY